MAYAQERVGDPAAVLNYLEEAAASVSAAIQQKKLSGGPAVRNVAAYLFRAFIRMVDDARRKEATLEQSIKEHTDAQAPLIEAAHAETTVLLIEVMASCDRVSRVVMILRLVGFSWTEIGGYFGISAHAARSRFRKALDRARKTLKIPRRKG